MLGKFVYLIMVSYESAMHVHSSDNVFNSTHTYGCVIDGSDARTVY